MPATSIDELLSPSFVADLQSLTLDEVRSKRADCQQAEMSLSYLRRVVQGHLDILTADLDRRAGGASPDLSDLVERLPQILSEHDRPSGLPRPDSFFEPEIGNTELVTELTKELNEIVNVEQLGQLPEVNESEIRTMTDRLNDFERRISDQRRALHDHLDALQEEIVRRYKSGEATVEGLLT